MSLVAGSGPLSRDRAGRLTPPIGDDLVYIEPHPRRIQAIRDGHAVIDTERALLVHRRGHPLSFAFAADEIGGLSATPVPEAPGYVVVPWTDADVWLEEGRRLVHYPPNPYHRVDCRPTTRNLRVDVADTTLVDTVDTVILFETALPPRLYVDPALVRTALLRRSPTTSYCNYKGYATYWSVIVPDAVVEDAAWSYDEPLPESLPIRGMLSFDETKLDVRAELPQPRP
ncbi:DUF427 domain-containing protein [Mycolicibacterium hippocampi]|uniref:DUF427 domain-containing protein n=1 Tax=Mycolicibacterium hippocampi TaxID=659824 RepID=A0A850Q090_9MYCO|nr:DUF427 domain-containing protein [Mycolicibacterium hippocampi]NVN54083.1 hypothetical protein [Mycolicibacterium hippocampi]